MENDKLEQAVADAKAQISRKTDEFMNLQSSSSVIKGKICALG